MIETQMEQGVERDHEGVAEAKHYGLTAAPIPCFPANMGEESVGSEVG